MRRLLVMLWGVVVACSETGAPRVGSAHELSFSKITVLEYEHGKLVYRATAEAAVGDRSSLSLSGVKAYHRGVDQTGPIELSSTHATVDIKRNSVGFERGVRITDSFGRVVKSDAASFDGTKQNLLVPGAMTVNGPDVTFSANGLTGSNDEEQLELKGPVEGWFKLAPAPTPK